MKKLVIIDGNAILHRAFHALPNLTTKSGEPINAVYGLISMLLRVIQDLSPTHLAVAFDEKEPTFRHKEFVSYQSHRPRMDDGLSCQFEKARQTMKAFAVPVYSKPGFEADDVIGTIAKVFSGDVIIVTGDRDILQLVDKKTQVYMPVVGMSQGKLMGEKEVIEKMGVKPVNIPDYKALAGDASDNYPGVPGVGPKTAVNLINEFGDFPEIYKHLDKIPEKTKEKLEKGREMGELSHRLATIVRDVPVDFNEEKSMQWDVDSKQVLELFQEYGFKTLTERVKKVGKELDQRKQMTLL